MNRTTARTTALAAVLAAATAACASLDPRPDRSRYFSLPTEPPAAPSDAPAVSLGLGPVTLPPYVDRPELATRVGPAEIAYAADSRWAAPLGELVRHALEEDLRARLPARDVVRWPWPLGNPPDVAVSVDVLRFEADAAGGATLEARWVVTAPGQAPATGRTLVQEPGPRGDAAASALSLSRALGALASEIAATARRALR